MEDIKKIYSGETGAVYNVKPVPTTDVSTGGWVCRIVVSEQAGATPVLDRSVTDYTENKEAFIAYLTPAETSSIGVGTWLQVIEVSNDTTIPPFNIEKHTTLIIKQGGAP